MAFESNIGASTVIHDGNAHRYVEQLRDTPALSAGYVERDYSQHGFGSYAPRFSGKIIPRSQWTDLIKMQEENQTSPWHVHKANKVPILDQNGLGYCWIYGPTAGVMNRYAAQGIPVPHLSATGPGAQGKNWQNKGGWAGEAIGYFKQYGIPTVQTWPEHSMDRRLAESHEVQLDAKRHAIVDFEEIQQENFDAAMSVLLDPFNPRPVTLGLMWWGHLVLGVRGVVLGVNRFGIEIANSWTPQWENEGFAVLAESKATAQEYIAIRSVKPRAA